MRNKRVLFITKKNECYGFKSYTRRSSGLYNSTNFIVRGLNETGKYSVDIVEVIDNNCIDRQVTKFKPDIVIIEALWVVPEKFPILFKLHPRVKWFIHMHSGMPFLALEGIAMDWIKRCAKQGIGIIANSPESYDAFRCILKSDEVVYLPNVYISHPYKPKKVSWFKPTVDVGCFGALRPMKNQLLQALASIKYANEKGKRLRFHLNSSRIEVGGQPCMKNLLQLFEHHPEHELVQHEWMEPDEFIVFLHQHIDIGLQVSMTETFNVVTADYVTAGLPVVISKEIKWASSLCRAMDDSVEDIVDTMNFVAYNRALIWWNQQLLKCHEKKATRMWASFVEAVKLVDGSKQHKHAA
jgi:hypothetical protein